MVKSLSMQDMLEMQVGSLGQEEPLEEEMETCSIILAWKIPWTEENPMSESQTCLSTQYLKHSISIFQHRT